MYSAVNKNDFIIKTESPVYFEQACMKGAVSFAEKTNKESQYSCTFCFREGGHGFLSEDLWFCDLVGINYSFNRRATTLLITVYLSMLHI